MTKNKLAFYLWCYVVFIAVFAGLTYHNRYEAKQFDYEIAANGETWVVSRIHWNFDSFHFNDADGNRVIIVGDAKVLRRTK